MEKTDNKGNMHTTVSASLPEPYYWVVRNLAANYKVSVAEVVRMLICDALYSELKQLPLPYYVSEVEKQIQQND